MKKKKLTPKQEKFCRVFIETGNQSEAYRQAYNTENMMAETVTKKASELMANGHVKGRVTQLQQQVAKKFEVTVESLTKEFEEDRQLARELGQPSAAIAATNGKARIHGLDKQVMSNDPDNPMPATINVNVVRK